jgi:hypothetical protein
VAQPGGPVKRFPPPRPLGRLAAFVWALLVIPLAAMIPPLALGVLLYGLDALATAVLLGPCSGPFGDCGGWGRQACLAARWFSMWWWLLAGLFAYPLWLATTVWLVRRIAAPGYRWRLGGSIAWQAALPVFVGCMMAWGAGQASGAKGGNVVATLLSAALLAGGLWLALRPLPADAPAGAA